MKNNIYIILSIFGLVIILLMLFFAWPLLIEVKNSSEHLASVKNDMVILDIQNNEIENFKINYQNYKANLEKMNQLFIDPQNPVDFIKFLENTASNSGIKSQISLLPASSQDNQNSITFQLFSSGDFLNI